LFNEDVKRTDYFQQFTKIGQHKEKRRFWYCKKCGTKNPIQVKTCIECGVDIKKSITEKE
jgi:ribosomal protein L40E